MGPGINGGIQLKEGRGRIALVLGGGAARGAAHLGVLRALEETPWEPDIVVGTSVGALVGAVYCREGSPGQAYNRLRQIALRIQSELEGLQTLQRLIRITKLFSKESRLLLLEDELGLKGLSFGQLQRPLYVTAARLPSLCRQVFGHDSRASVVEAVMASTALPSRGPYRVGSALYLDGAMAGNLPALVALEQGASCIGGPPILNQRRNP